MPPLLLVISQVYRPDPAAVGQQIADVASEMARRGWRVVVYTAAQGYDDPTRRYPSWEMVGDVQVRRLPFSSFGKRSIAVRLLAQVSFIVQATMYGLLLGRLSGVLVSTSPPFAGIAGLVIGFVRRIPYVWWVMDVNPDQLVASGVVRESSLYVRVFRTLNRLTLKRAKAVIALDRFMADRLASQALPPNGISITPPWAMTDVGWVSKQESENFRREHGIESKFVVMYSGNHALQHPLKTLLEAAEDLRGDSGIVFLFVGAGAGKADVDARIEAGATNLLSLPFQPAEKLRVSLGAADIHVVSMSDEVVGIVHPCKIYGAMAVGRPILFFGPDQSHGGELVRKHVVGWVVSHGEAASAAQVIQSAAALGASGRDELGHRAAEAIGRSYYPPRLMADVCDTIEKACDRADA